MTAPTRALQALDHLRAAAVVLDGRDRTPLDDALLDLFKATARYWHQWMPAQPTAMDRATLQLARAITQAPDATAGTQSHSTTTAHPRKDT